MLLKANRAILKPTSELGRPSSSPSSRSFVKERRNPVMATVRRANANLMSTFQRRLRQGLMLRTDYIRETLRCVACVFMSFCFLPVFGDTEPSLFPETLFQWLLVRRKKIWNS